MFKNKGNGDFIPLPELRSPSKQKLKDKEFQDGLDYPVPLTPPGNQDPFSDEHAAPRMNRTEQERLQGLMRMDTVTRRTGRQETMDKWVELRVWMVNEGSRRIFVGCWIALQLLLYGLAFTHFSLFDRLQGARNTFGITFPIARSAALVLRFDAAMILLPVCRNFISLLRRGPLNSFIPFEKNITFHIATAWSMVFFTAVHIIAHIFNVTWLSMRSNDPVKNFILANFITGPGLTGWIMTIALGVMVWYAMEKRRRANFERFWYSHHLFIVFFVTWQIHGMFCMIPYDTPPYCDSTANGTFWMWWLVSGVIFVWERVLREMRSRHETYISKVIQHPNNVVEVQIKKEYTKTLAGQYIFINCPEISYWQWHPFTLTSAPEEDFISVHVRMVGDFTKAFGKALGCEVEKRDKSEGGSAEIRPPLGRVLPRICVDGPFGSASEDFAKFEVSILVGAGIGVTPFASILKSIWYRLNSPSSKKTRLHKVYFIWVNRDFSQLEWFQSLLAAIEEQDVNNNIEIHAYLTAKIKDDDINNIFVQDVGGEKDTVSKLRAPTHYGRPNWDRIFPSVVEKHPSTEVGVFFCGPKVLGSTLHKMCNKYTQGTKDGTKFVWGKENF